MAADFYDEMSDFAVEILTEFNQAEYVLTRAGTPVSDPAHPELPPIPGTPQVWRPVGISEAVEAKYADGNTIKATDRQLLFAPFGDRPKQSDVLTINGEVATVLGIQPISERGCAWIVFVEG